MDACNEGKAVGEDEPGYQVTYQDGHEAWLPRHTFEMTYRVIDPQEIALVQQEYDRLGK